jgi:hypothetical protein
MGKVSLAPLTRRLCVVMRRRDKFTGLEIEVKGAKLGQNMGVRWGEIAFWCHARQRSRQICLIFVFCCAYNIVCYVLIIGDVRIIS